jgi:hypothetical protein
LISLISVQPGHPVFSPLKEIVQPSAFLFGHRFPRSGPRLRLRGLCSIYLSRHFIDRNGHG